MMKTHQFLLLFLLGTFIFAACSPQKEPLIDVVEKGLKRSEEQALLMAGILENQPGRLPKTIGKDSTLETSDYRWWCSGFFPGELWYLYENNPTSDLEKYARLFTGRVEKAKNITYSHDVGFMLYCSFGNGLRLTGDTIYQQVLETGARSLATRYDSVIGVIRSWDFNKQKWQYPVIIDNMMNLELLMWTAKHTGDESFEKMAVSHADVTMMNHFRDDYSCYHVVSYDTITGRPHIKQTHQGAADESAWARGQAWALYGYTMMYRETGERRYWEQAKRIAEFLMNHPRMPLDKIPYWDFDAPGIPDVPRDASAAAVMASAFTDLSRMDDGEFGKRCFDMAEQQIRSLTSPEYLASSGTNRFFILKHSTGNYPGQSEVDVPLTYADYYYVEALMRMKKILSRS